MNGQFDLFKQRKFTPMFLTQFLGAFNDNIFKQGLILVLTFIGSTQLNLPISILNNLAALLFILPYFLFSALAGQVADKYEKSTLTKKIKLLEIIIMAVATVGFVMQIYWLLFLALFLMGTHSTFFGPIKYAYLPEVMEDKELVAANGLFQMGTSLAILTGMILAGILTQFEHSLYWLSAITLSIALLGFLAASFLPNTHKANLTMTIDWNIWRTSYDIIKYLYNLPLLFFVIIGNSWYWYYGATFLTQTAEFGKTILHGNESVIILLLTLFSVGIAFGSILCKSLSKNQVSLQLFPIGVLGLTLLTIDLYFASQSYMPNNSQYYQNVSQILQTNGIIRILMDLFLLGVFGGIYIVPLYAFMQAYAPVSHRSRIIGANNIFNAIFMVLSAIVAMIVVGKLGYSVSELFLMIALLNAIIGMVLYHKLKVHRHTIKPNEQR